MTLTHLHNPANDDHDAPLTGHSPSAPKGWGAVVDEFRARRVAHAARRTLERELVGYAAPADRHVADAMLSRYEAAEAEKTHNIIDRRLLA